MGKVIECVELVKRFKDVVALDGLTLEVPKGHIFGLIGPNGAGKTTTIRIILGLLRPDSGEVRLFGEDPWNNPEVRARVGVLHEHMELPCHVRARELLEHVARIYGVPEPAKRAVEALELVGLKEAWNRRVGALSAGMKQRLCIAQALLHEPELVIADEPLANLDPLGRSEVLDLMARLHKEEGVDFVVSSHILPELGRICDSVAFVHRGRIHLTGALDELMAQFGRSFRVSVSDPRALRPKVLELPYIRDAYISGRDLMVEVEEGHEDEFYGTIRSLAREVGVEFYGLESRVASLEDLFRRMVLGRLGG
ncbi:ABC transporter ATP-binding protein [Candidatus Bathyarchaeota archaeon]|nr:MAG: ABC transporter ATP-binding protein [Candidatus Bathyarchaeota archaeon]